MKIHLLILTGWVLLGLWACRSDSIPRARYQLTVQGGAGSGAYEAGTVVPIAAQAPRRGLRFSHWSGGLAWINDSLAAETELLMPEQDLRLVAQFADTQRYALSVGQGQGSGSYRGGTPVQVQADPPNRGEAFYCWTGDSGLLADPWRDSTTLVMPYAEAELLATYEALPRYALTVDGGEGGGEYWAGDTVWIEADAPASGYAFDRWEGGQGRLADSLAARTWLLMPEEAVGLTAQYRILVPPVLTVINGQGSGPYSPGTRVWVEADPAVVGQRFIRWSGQIDPLADMLRPRTSLILEEDVTVEALFRFDSLPIFSYQLDIKPLMGAHCDACHYDGAEYSDLSHHAGLYAYRDQVRSLILSGYMPPAGRLSEEEVQVIVRWIDAGALNN